MGSPFAAFFGFAVYAAIHSALLTRSARRVLEAAVGPRAFQGLFRLFFSVQAVVLLAVYVVWVAQLPDRELLRLEGLWAGLLWSLRLAALLFIVRCVGRFGFSSFLGWEQFRDWLGGTQPAGDGVETGELVVSDAYRYVRHPMYAAGFVVLWADPTWTVNYLAFAAAASLYLYLGALHEERRLLAYYGEDYRRYRERTPRFVPGRGG